MSELPQYGLTLQAPWWSYIIYADKTWENRGSSVAGRIGDYRGRVLLTASATHKDVEEALKGRKRSVNPMVGDRAHPVMVRDVIAARNQYVPWWSPIGMNYVQTAAWMARHAGMAVGTALIADVVAPNEHHISSRYRQFGQWGIILRDPEPMTPRPASGGLGCWAVHECECGRICADSQIARHRARCEVA